MPVRTPPGCTTVTPTPRGASSCRSASVNPRTAYLLVEYATWPGGAIRPNRLEMFTRCEPGRASNCGRNALVIRITACRLISSSQSTSSSRFCSNVPESVTPALLIRRSAPPRRDDTSAARSLRSSPSARSMTYVETSVPPSSRAAAATRSSPSASRSTSTSAARRRASSSVRAAPIPPAAPVITQVRPANVKRRIRQVSDKRRLPSAQDPHRGGGQSLRSEATNRGANDDRVRPLRPLRPAPPAP